MPRLLRGRLLLVIGRRRFLQGAALAALPLGCEMELRSSPPKERIAKTFPATHHAIATTYPPLAPLGDGVFAARRDRARALVREVGSSMLIVPSGSTNFTYLSGASFGRSERLIALVLPVQGEPFLVAPSFEVERVARRARGIAIAAWQESESPYDVLRDKLGESRAEGGALVDPHAELATAHAFAKAMPRVTIAPATELLDKMRVKKTEEELVRMRRAIAITEDAIARTFERLEAGMRDSDVRAIIKEEHERRGVDGDALVQLGPDSAMPHGLPQGARLDDEMVVLIDGGCTVEGYWSDISRTRWFGSRPSDRFRAIYNLVHDAQTAAIARAKPGAPCESVDAAAREVIANGGFGEHFTHRLGHGIGLDGHEAAYMVKGNAAPVEPGFVFSVEPGVYLPGELGVRLEDDVVCGGSGAIVMSRRAPRV